MGTQKQTSVKVVRPVFGDDLNLRAAITAVLRVVVVGDDFHFLHRLFIGRYHRRSAPGNTGDADAVNGDVVGFHRRAVGDDLRLVLGLENSRCGA